jgi:hypothetical protein
MALTDRIILALSSEVILNVSRNLGLVLFLHTVAKTSIEVSHNFIGSPQMKGRASIHSLIAFMCK